MTWTKLVDLELDDEEKFDTCCPSPNSPKPDYPWGLQITLTDKELKKLDLDADCEIGDVIDLRAFAVVTSVSKNSTDKGDQCSVSLQIQKLAIENEMTENMED